MNSDKKALLLDEEEQMLDGVVTLPHGNGVTVWFWPPAEVPDWVSEKRQLGGNSATSNASGLNLIPVISWHI